jgi:hypothetical protein
MTARSGAQARRMTMRRPQQDADSPWHYEVIGEHLVDPTRLLVMGEDGRFYALDLHDGATSPAEFSEEWIVDTCDLREKLQRLHAA